MIKAYFDGSGKEDQHEYITLAGLSAEDSPRWESFKNKWNELLNENEQWLPNRNGVPYFHASEIYSETKLSEAKKNEIFDQFLNVVASMQHPDFITCSCTIEISGYRDAKRRIRKLKKWASICLDHCAGTPLVLSPMSENCIELVFDANEDFLKEIHNLFNWGVARNKPGWYRMVNKISAGKMMTTPELQAADLLGWVIHRYHENKNDKRDKWYKRLVPSPMVQHVFLDGSKISEIYG